MADPKVQQTTELLNRASRGDRKAASALMEDVYDDLRVLAAKALSQEAPGHTLQPTALVHEAYLRLVDQDRVEWKGRTHFFAVAAREIRRILVDHARHKKAQKRGGGWVRVTVDALAERQEDAAVDVLDLDEALEELGRLQAEQAAIVELHFFGGLTFEEIAERLGVSLPTVKRHWRMARAWLHRRLRGPRP